MTQTAPRIAATLIVRDEARCIERCIKSVAPWVDRMVVLDTGSTDDTGQIAQRLGAEVHSLAWPDSFSIARNHVLALADADWNLMIDADEWISSGGAMLRSWCKAPTQLGRLCVHNEAEDGSTVRSWITRIVPRGVRYEGRVHEQVVSALPRASLDLHLCHDGYRESQIRKKRHRNQPLLILDLADRSDDPYILYQLGKDAEMRSDVADACDHYGRAIVLTPPDANWRHDLVIRAIGIFSRGGRLDEAFALAEAEFNNWPESPDFFFVLGDMLLDHAVAEPARAINH